MGVSPALRTLYKHYLEALPKIGVYASSDAREWTRHIKEYWAKEGIGSGFQVWASGIDLKHADFHKKEYMIDVLWKTDSRRTAQIQMALECEWSKNLNDVLWDFGKLVYVKAGQKLMVFQASSQNDPHFVRELTSLVKRCRTKQEPADQYLLIRHKDWRPEPGRLIQLMRGYIVDQNGSCEPLGEEREIVIA